MIGSERLAFGHGRHAAVPSTAVAAAARYPDEPPPVRLSHPETWDWGWGGLLIFTVLVFFRPQDSWGALGPLHLSDAAALLGLAAMTFINLSRNLPPTRVTAELVGVLLLGAVILATIPFSYWPGGSTEVFTDLYMQVALIFLLMVNTVTSPRRVERICWVIVLAFGYVSARVVFDYLRGVNLIEGHRARGPVGGFFENPNDLALNLAAFLPLTLMYVKRPGPLAKRALCAVFAVLMLAAIVFTKSRTGFIGTVAMLLVFVIVARLVTPRNIMIGIIAGIVILPALPSSFWQRMQGIIDPTQDETGSREERRLLMEQAWGIFLDNPLTGIGAGQFKNYAPEGQQKKWRVTHNALLQVGAEVGVFGLVTFAFLIVRAFAAANWTRRQLAWVHRKHGKRREAAEGEDGLSHDDRVFLQTTGAALVACLTGWFVCALFASVAFNWTFYYLLGLAVTSRAVVRARAAAHAKARAAAMAGVAA
jgi:O-antigen ligase